MAPALRWISMGLYIVLSVFIILFGALYATVQDFLPFHGAAIDERLHERVKPLYLALMTLIGSIALSLGGLGLIVTLGPVRHGALWAAAALTAVQSFAFVMAGITAVLLARRTGAPTGWENMAILTTITVVALITHLFSRRRLAP